MQLLAFTGYSLRRMLPTIADLTRAPLETRLALGDWSRHVMRSWELDVLLAFRSLGSNALTDLDGAGAHVLGVLVGFLGCLNTLFRPCTLLAWCLD